MFSTANTVYRPLELEAIGEGHSKNFYFEFESKFLTREMKKGESIHSPKNLISSSRWKDFQGHMIYSTGNFFLILKIWIVGSFIKLWPRPWTEVQSQYVSNAIGFFQKAPSSLTTWLYTAYNMFVHNHVLSLWV